MLVAVIRSCNARLASWTPCGRWRRTSDLAALQPCALGLEPRTSIDAAFAMIIMCLIGSNTTGFSVNSTDDENGADHNSQKQGTGNTAFVRSVLKQPGLSEHRTLHSDSFGAPPCSFTFHGTPATCPLTDALLRAMGGPIFLGGFYFGNSQIHAPIKDLFSIPRYLQYLQALLQINFLESSD